MGKTLAKIGIATLFGLFGGVFAEGLEAPGPEIKELREPAPLIHKATPEMVEHIRIYETVKKLSLLGISYDINDFLMLVDPDSPMVMLATPVDIDMWGTPERAENAFMEEFPYIYADIHYDEERKMYFGVFINISKHIMNRGLTDPNNIVNSLLEIGVDNLTAARIADDYFSLHERVKELEVRMGLHVRNSSRSELVERTYVPKEYRPFPTEQKKKKTGWHYPSNRISIGFNNSTKILSTEVAIALARHWIVELGAEYSNDEMSNMTINNDYEGVGIYTRIGLSYRPLECISLSIETEGLCAKKNDSSKYSYTIVPSTAEAGVGVMLRYIKMRLSGERKIFAYFPYDDKIFPLNQEYTVNTELSWRFPAIKFIEWTIFIEDAYQKDKRIMANKGMKIGVVW